MGRGVRTASEIRLDVRYEHLYLYNCYTRTRAPVRVPSSILLVLLVLVLLAAKPAPRSYADRTISSETIAAGPTPTPVGSAEAGRNCYGLCIVGEGAKFVRKGGNFAKRPTVLFFLSCGLRCSCGLKGGDTAGVGQSAWLIHVSCPAD
eukprot:1810362-Rhodomonas_salina.1